MKQLFIRHQGRLLRFFANHAINRWDAEELTQEVFCKILKRKDVNPDEYTNAYMFTIAWSVLRDRARRERVRHRNMHIEYKAEALEQVQVESVSPENTLQHDELHKRFLTELNELSPMTRAVFVLNRYSGFTYSQIAEHFDISVSAVEKHMIKALRKMRAIVKNQDV